MACGFTEEHYAEIMQSFFAAGYRFVCFRDFVPGVAHQVILRHDVDLSLDHALRIARVDSGLGVASVFHILLTAEVYNPASRGGQSILHTIRELGHRIGLHVDPSALLGSDSNDLGFQAGAANLFDMARRILGPLDSYSIHRPATGGRMNDVQPASLGFPVPPYAYEGPYRQHIPYRSDSRREWRGACICSELAHLAGSSLQLLLHPIWWSPKACVREQVLDAYLLQCESSAEGYLQGNLSFYHGGARARVTGEP